VKDEEVEANRCTAWVGVVKGDVDERKEEVTKKKDMISIVGLTTAKEKKINHIPYF